jgi:hypothetical protein
MNTNFPDQAEEIKRRSHLHDQCRGIAEPVAAQDHQNARRISQRRSGAEVVVSGSVAGGEEVDHADLSLAGSAEPLHDSVAGTDASPGESRIMKAQNLSKIAGQGKGNSGVNPWTETQS